MRLSPRLHWVGAVLAAAITVHGSGSGAQLRRGQLQGTLERLASGVDGHVGVCASDASGSACVNGTRRFPLQSVMKLLVGVAVLDAVDRKSWRLDDVVLVRREDLSVFVQPLADLVTDKGFRTTIADLVRRAIVDSDSAATDVLIARLGGIRAVQEVLDLRHVSGVRIDRDERHLQTDILGLTWRQEFVDPAVLDRAIAAVPDSARDAAFRAYQKDPRDTATPEGMATLLQLLAGGRLLPMVWTRLLIDIMSQTATFPDRLKAGVTDGWTLAHKTGTSGTWHGVTAATNDVGILRAPDGSSVSIAVFIADSHAPADHRAMLMARMAAATIQAFR